MTATLIPGWMGTKSRKWLLKNAKRSQNIIEVGVWMGRSTQMLAQATKGTVWAVDHWLGTPEDPPQHEKLYGAALADMDVYQAFRLNLSREIQAGKVIPVRMESVKAARHLLRIHGRIFDFVFIDADHSYEGVSADIDAYLPLVVSGGLLAGHDYHWPGVQRAVDERFPDAVKGPKTLWSIRV